MALIAVWIVALTVLMIGLGFVAATSSAGQRRRAMSSRGSSDSRGVDVTSGTDSGVDCDASGGGADCGGGDGGGGGGSD